METVERNSRGARWLHAAVYVTVIVLLATGWWFVAGGYRPSVLERLTGVPDGTVHEVTGYLLLMVVAVGVVRGRRGAQTFARETLRRRRGDGRWLLHWPRAAVTGRFPDHDGHFDPGQRLANVLIVGALSIQIITGLGMLYGPAGLPWYPVHRWSAFLLTPVLLGHVVVASGVLPGYRGVWRSMHLGGRLPADVARRLWPSGPVETGRVVDEEPLP